MKEKNFLKVVVALLTLGIIMALISAVFHIESMGIIFLVIILSLFLAFLVSAAIKTIIEIDKWE